MVQLVDKFFITIVYSVHRLVKWPVIYDGMMGENPGVDITIVLVTFAMARYIWCSWFAVYYMTKGSRHKTGTKSSLNLKMTNKINLICARHSTASFS